jgi:predicted membrane metal-binding protein
MRGGLHENLESRTTDGPGSERGFAIVFAVVFVLVGLWPLLSGGLVRAWALLIAAAFLLAGFAAPGILAPLNRLWFRFGMALGRIVSPVVMGVTVLRHRHADRAVDAAVPQGPAAAALRSRGGELLDSARSARAVGGKPEAAVLSMSHRAACERPGHERG